MNKLVVILIILILIIAFLVNRQQQKRNNFKNYNIIDKIETNKIQEEKKDIEINKIDTDEKHDVTNLTLLDAFEIIKAKNPGVKSINGNYSVEDYNKFIIDEHLKLEVDILLKTIISNINNIINSNFVITSYDNIVVKTNVKNKNELIYNIVLFIHDYDVSIMKKIIIEIYKLNNSKHINYIKLSNCKLLEKDCYLEKRPKTNKTVTFNLNHSYEDITKTNKNPSLEYYKEPTENIKFQLKGKIKTNLENSNIKDYQNVTIEKSLQRNKWILPNNVKDSHNNAFPCKKNNHTWGKFGILNTKEDTNDCYGTDMAIEKRPIYNNLTPDHVKLDRYNNYYNNLFTPDVKQHTNWH